MQGGRRQFPVVKVVERLLQGAPLYCRRALAYLLALLSVSQVVDAVTPSLTGLRRSILSFCVRSLHGHWKTVVLPRGG